MLLYFRVKGLVKIIFLLVIFSSTTLYAGIEWQWVNPTPQGNDLNGVVYNGTNPGVVMLRPITPPFGQKIVTIHHPHPGGNFHPWTKLHSQRKLLQSIICIF